ncbi:MAG: NAD-dependent epimerase/dehydratase family protein [Actinobacteria bacterium]|nr:NAD-dependent epimerase/dehydratase family protein [Actinomycetota bacterium]
MKVLVTGGAGFIGSHLCEALLAQGDTVISLDDLSTGNSSNLQAIRQNPKFTSVTGSILDESLVEKLISSVDGVMHFAAAVGVQKILKDPQGSLLTNIQGTEIVLNIASRLKKKSMLASSSEIYGKNPMMPLTEESDRVLGSPLVARWTYSEAKAIDEGFARTLFDKEGFKVSIVRLFNTVGPRQSPAYGMVIPRFFEAALQNLPITIHGDGTQQRVFGHVSDAIAGILALWNCDEGYGEAFNLGGFEETTINDLASRIIELTNSKSEIRYQSYQELSKEGFEDLARRVPDTSKLTKLTGWKATKNLSDILSETHLHLTA